MTDLISYQWFESEVPAGLEVRQVYGFIFNADGQILLLEDEGTFTLPGGKPEHGEGVRETLVRESLEEAQTHIGSTEYLGYQLVESEEQIAQVRLVALLDHFLESAQDPSTGKQYKRIWMPPLLANELLQWGHSGDQQIASAIARVLRMIDA